jgi:hypothetical protein
LPFRPHGLLSLVLITKTCYTLSLLSLPNSSFSLLLLPASASDQTAIVPMVPIVLWFRNLQVEVLRRATGANGYLSPVSSPRHPQQQQQQPIVVVLISAPVPVLVPASATIPAPVPVQIQAPASMVPFCLSPPSSLVHVNLLPNPTGALRNASSPLTTTLKYKTSTMKTNKTPAPFEDCLRPIPTDTPPDLRPTPTPAPATAPSLCGPRTNSFFLRTFPTHTTAGGTPPKWLLWLQRKSTRWRPTR